MIIIFEGLDKAGKSSILNEILIRQSGTVSFKLSEFYKPKINDPMVLHDVRVAYDELFNQARRLSYDFKKVVLFDRAYPSEMVYSTKRGYDALDDDFWWQLDEQLGKFGDAGIVYCEVPNRIGIERMRRENEEYLQPREYEFMRSRYEEFLNKTKLPVLRLDTTEPMDLNHTKVLKAFFK